MNSSESWRFKELALAVVACFFLAAPAPVSATSFPQTTDATVVLKPVGINVLSELQLGRVLAPPAGTEPTIFFINRFDSSCGIHVNTGGECMDGGTRRRGNLQITGAPNTTVSLSSNISRPAGGTGDTDTGVDCTGGSGTTPVKVTFIFFTTTSSRSVTLDSTGTSPETNFGAWFAVWDTSAGTLGQDWSCAYSISADY